ncbi:MAG: hypothetical protein ACFFDP_06115 [Promethearchaeota archaeon]
MEEVAAILSKGKQLMRQRKWSEAVACFEQLLKQKPPPEIEREAQELAYDCFLMLSEHMPVQSIAIPALGGWSQAKTPKERRAIIAEANAATAAHINERLGKFEKEIDEVIASAATEYQEHPEQRDQVYRRVLEEIDRILGPGCLGPATAAAAPLAERKRKEVAELFDIPLGDF